jgi:hypothetical protein
LRYFEGQITPELQQEINALQLDVLYQAGLLPTQPEAEQKATLSFDGMLHEARSHMRCSSVQASCYEPTPRPCPAQDKGKQGCDCDNEDCAAICRHTTPLDPDARFIVYTGNHKRARTTPNTPIQPQDRRSRISRMVYGYYSYAGQLLADDIATYWILPAAFGSAICGDPTLFPANFAYLQARFPWLKIGAVIADAGACEQTCLDAIWNAGALRMVDICAHQSDADPDTRLARGYDENGYPLCPFTPTATTTGGDEPSGVVPSAAYVIPITLYLSAITSNPNTSTATPSLSDAPTPMALSVWPARSPTAVRPGRSATIVATRPRAATASWNAWVSSACPCTGWPLAM